MTLNSPTPFKEALKRMDRASLPTNLTSAELSQLSADVTERGFFSAQNMLEQMLDEMSKRVTDILNPRTEVLADGHQFTAGIDPATARLEIKQLYQKFGYQPEPGKKGTIEDLSSDARINLVIDFNATEAASYGYYRDGQDPAALDAFPAQELVRFEERKEPRDWGTIWQNAAGEVGDDVAAAVFRQTGRMIARKDSAIWTAISDFGRPWAPFKFGSGMNVQDVPRDEAIDLGVIDADTSVVPQRVAFNTGKEAA